MANNAVQFDGSTQYGTVANFAGIDGLTPGALTIEGWLYIVSTANYSFPWDLQTAAGASIAGMEIPDPTSTNYVNFHYDYDGATNADGVSTAGYPNNQWFHLTLSCAVGVGSKVYLNGVETGYSFGPQAPAGNPTSPSGGRFTLATGNDISAVSLTGYIGGYVRVWNYRRTPAQLKQNLTNHLVTSKNPGLIINLTFSEGSGATIGNEAAPSAPCTLTGSPTWSTGPTIENLSSIVLPAPYKNNIRPAFFTPGNAR